MEDKPARQQIDDIITKYGGWKGEILAKIRQVVLAADPEAVEEIKWKMATRPEGLPVWSHNGILCYTETFKNDIKLVFAKGARINDSYKAFNARLNSSAVRAIELHEGDSVNEAAVASLVKEAAALNAARPPAK